jgi:hypothetical protein
MVRNDIDGGETRGGRDCGELNPARGGPGGRQDENLTIDEGRRGGSRYGVDGPGVHGPGPFRLAQPFGTPDATRDGGW